MIIIIKLMIIILLHSNSKNKKNPADEIQTDSPAGLFVQLKAQSPKPKANTLNY